MANACTANNKFSEDKRVWLCETSSYKSRVLYERYTVCLKRKLKNKIKSLSGYITISMCGDMEVMSIIIENY